MNTISRWSARVCRTRRNPIQHPHSVSLSRGRSDSHNPTHCISARMTAIARPRETDGYNPEFLSARKTTFHSSLLTRLRQTAATRRLPPGRAAATHPSWDAVTRSLLASPITNAYISLYSHIPPAACYSHEYRRLSHPPPNMAWSVGRRGAMNPICVWVNCYCIISSLGATTLESRPLVSRAS